MKKIISIILVLLSVSLQDFAQQYINLYQDDVIIKQYSTEEIDSMSITEEEPRIISFWRDGEVFQTYNTADIDSIKVANRGGAPFTYIGIVGFNNQLHKKDVGILSPTTASQYKSFVNNLSRQDGTILYNAVDNALDMLNDANIDSPLKSVNVITFTDGLDQGSLMMTDKYSSSSDYLNALGERIATTKIDDLPVNSYSVGLRGFDVSNESLFKQNLLLLASSVDKSFEVSSIADLRSRFQNIANQIISVSTRQTMSVRFPGVDNGTRVRFVFDGKPAENSELYIEGTFDLQDKSLHDVIYHGIKATSGKTVQGTQDGIFLTYTFTGMRPEVGKELIQTSSVKHYYKYPSSTAWQVNSEFSPASNTQRKVSHSGTSIMLVLDCSSSLGSDFGRMQQYANEFIDLIANNAEPFELLTPKNVKAQIDEDKLVVNVTWDEVKYAKTYNIYRSSSTNGTYQLIAEGVLNNTWTDESPLEGYNFYKICAVNRNSITSQSSYASAYVILNSTSNVKAELSVKYDKLVVDISWEGVKYAQGYNIYRGNSSSGTVDLIAEGITSTSWTDNSPLEGYYYYAVKATGYGFVKTESSSVYVNVNLNSPTNVMAVLDAKDLIVNVSWDAVKFAQGYNVYRSNNINGIYNMVAAGVSSTFWTDISPLSGENYYVISATGYGLTSSQSYSVSTNVTLASPTNIKAKMGENKLAVIVSWDAVKFAQYYNVYRSNTSSGSYQLIAENVVVNSWTDESPLKGNNYYKVLAVNRNTFSSQSSYTSANVILNAPINVKTQLDVKGDKFVINVSWDAVKFAQYYNVYRSSSSGGTYNLVAKGISAELWVDESPLKNSNYYKVVAVSNDIESVKSNYSNLNIQLSVPTNVKAAIDSGDFVVNVSWNEVKFAQSYEVYRSTTPSGIFSLVAENVESTIWTDTNPLEGRNYYKVCATGYGVTSSQSSYTSVDFSLNPPTNVNAVSGEKDFVINVTWDAVKYAQCYNIYRSSNSNGTYQLVADKVSSTSWTDNSPLLGDNYYKVCAVNRNITSLQSLYAYVNMKIESPVNLTGVLDAKAFIVNISWDAVNYAQSYTVYRSNNSDGTYQMVAENIVATSWTDNSPLEGFNYYKICAVGHGYNSPQSSFTFVNVSLETPANVKAVLEIPSYVVNISWDAVKYAKSYNVYRSSTIDGVYELMAENIVSTSWTDNKPIGRANYYKVCAVAYNYKSAQSPYSLVNVNVSPPYKEEAKLEVANDKIVIKISWQEEKYAQSYNVYRRGNYGSSYDLIAEGVTSNSWTDEKPLQGYNNYCISTVCNGIESILSLGVAINNNKSVITVNGVSFLMTHIEGGTFQMGATTEQMSDDNDMVLYKYALPVHQVRLSNYKIGETEVTQELWEAVMGNNPCYYKGALLPVSSVSWDDCQTFIKKLNNLTGLKFRLPTEAEWEYAARGSNYSSGYKYSGSNDLGSVSWCGDNYTGMPHDVGTKAPNELGIYDMSGNVKEWCQDWYGSYYSDSQTNPTGPKSGTYRVARGGSFNERAYYCSVSCRISWFVPSEKNISIGFRLAQ